MSLKNKKRGRVAVRDATYLIDIETGNFSKTASGETVYGNLDGLELKLRYDVLAAINNGAA